jgi:hypothetical protein
MIKTWIQKLVTLYAANGKFHSFVNAVAFAVVSELPAALSGLSLSKQGLAAFIGFIGGAIKGAITGWLRNNVALPTVQGNGAPTPISASQLPQVAPAKGA